MASRVVTFARPLQRRVRLHALQGLGREVDRRHLVRLPRDLQREAAVVGEAVEHAPAGVLPRRQVVLALVEEEAGLLPLAQVHPEPHVAFRHLDGLGHLAVERPTPSAPGPRASAPAGRCARRCPAAAAGPRAPPRSRASPARCPATASGSRGSRRSGRPPATGSRRPRRGRRGTPRPRPRPSPASAGPARCGRGGSPRGAPRPRSTMRSRISECDDQKREAERRPPHVGHAHDRARRGPAVLDHVGAEDPRVPALDARLALAG